MAIEGIDSFPRFVDPHALLSPRRMDVVVKFLYFRSILDMTGISDAERLYRWHIEKRTKGREKNPSVGTKKSNVDDYITHSIYLLRSMNAKGFDSDYPVPIGNNGIPLDGAHRIACALAMNRPVAIVDDDRKAKTWGFEWFVKNGARESDLDRITLTWNRLNEQKARMAV
jgi:hypothetical protein